MVKQFNKNIKFSPFGRPTLMLRAFYVGRSISNMINRILFALLPLLTLVACSDSLESQVHNLVTNKNIWIDGSLGRNYSFVLKVRCFCPHNNRPIKIFVSNNEIISAKYVNREFANVAIDIGSLPTIKKLFILILEALNSESRTVKAEYNQQFGFPSFIEIEMDSNIMDNRYSFSVTDISLQ